MIENLIQELSYFGKVQNCKAGHVFTILILGEGLNKMTEFNEICGKIISTVGDKYPNVEVVSNSNTHFLIVLKPKTITESRGNIKFLMNDLEHMKNVLQKGLLLGENELEDIHTSTILSKIEGEIMRLSNKKNNGSN